MGALHGRAAAGLLALTQVFLAKTVLCDPAPSGRVALVWTVPPECPSEGAVLAEMERVLGGPPSRGAKVKAEVEELGAHLWSEHLATEVEGVFGERTLEADSCEGLAAATALILAWTIDPARAAEAPLTPRSASLAGPPPAPPPESAPPPLAVEASPPQPSPPRPSPRAVAPPSTTPTEPYRGPRAFLAIEGMGDLGTQPQVGLAGRVTLGVLFGRVRLEASVADWYAENAYTSPPFSSQGTTLHPWEGAFRGCLRWEPAPRLEVDPCLGGGVVHVTSNGFNETVAVYQADTSWGSLYGDALGVWTFADPFALRASLGIAVPLSRPEFDIEEPTGQPSLPLHHAFYFAGRAILGIEVRFP
jgi:hypothetical protein